MKFEKFVSRACCGGTSITIKIDRPITKDLLDTFVSNGFKETVHFTKSGILYLDNEFFIITGPFGTNKLQIKCRKKYCEQNLSNLQIFLEQII